MNVKVSDEQLVAEGLHPKDVLWLEERVNTLEAALREIAVLLERIPYYKRDFKPGVHPHGEGLVGDMPLEEECEPCGTNTLVRKALARAALTPQESGDES